VSEFTGERVIPGEVNSDLWAEHVARYHFAARYAAEKSVLDIACGSGYGTAQFARQAAVAVGIDICFDPLKFAREHDTAGHYAQASATALPFRDHSFDVVTAFEAIEHLRDWRALLSETRRVVRPDGLFFISTPNRLYYAESRAHNGPNPFHVHEFEFEEFRDALAEFFPHVTFFLQNWNPSISFTAVAEREEYAHALIAAADGSPPADAHFFLAICSTRSRPEVSPFVFVPSAANQLREREKHIQLLERELQQNREWLAAATADRNRLIEIHEEQKQQLEEHNRWAQQLDRDWKSALARVAQLQDDFRQLQDAATLKLADLESENRDKTQWALETEQRLSQALAAKCDELAQAVELLETAEATVVERTHWAQDLQQRVEFLEAQLGMIRDSRWVKLGRAAGIGPKVQF